MRESSPNIAVIMSTYNGSSCLKEQMDSILGQTLSNVSIFVRDDGSKDNTVRILQEYERLENVYVFAEENVGVVLSFLDCLARVPKSFDYIALCDQDDIWHADKLERAVSILSQKDNSIPQLYCSEYTFCDAEMNQVGRSHLNQIGVSFSTMLYENMVSGNTCVMNRALADAIVKAGSKDVYCHDWWIALVATALGELTYDDFSSLEYRRTGSNASPTGSSGIKLLRYRVKTFFQKGQLSNITRQLERLDELYSDRLSPQKAALLKRAIKGNGLQKATIPSRLRQKPAEEAALRLLLLTNRL